jgi:hypothetical protein
MIGAVLIYLLVVTFIGSRRMKAAGFDINDDIPVED